MPRTLFAILLVASVPLLVACNASAPTASVSENSTEASSAVGHSSATTASWTSDQEAIAAFESRIKEADRRQLFRDFRSYVSTELTDLSSGDQQPEPPPADLALLVKYPAPLGDQWAYLAGVQDAGLVEAEATPRPAVIYLSGGFSNEIGSWVFEDQDPSNDQSGRAFVDNGFVVMYPSLRGGNGNPGTREGLYGEVDDVLAALEFLKAHPAVDSNRIYLVGHSTGGTLALLVAALTDDFASVVAYGPVGSVYGYGNNVPANLERDVELFVRSPVFWLGAVSSPTFIIEGEGGNIDSLKLMESGLDGNLSNLDAPLTFCELAGHDHFSLLGRANAFVATQIAQATGPLNFTGDQLVKACR